MENAVNPDPTKQVTEVLFSCKKSNPNHPQLSFNGTVEAKVNEQKHLGLLLDSTQSFGKHINEKNIGILKHLSKCLPLKTLDQMYNLLLVHIVIIVTSFITYHLV